MDCHPDQIACSSVAKAEDGAVRPCIFEGPRSEDTTPRLINFWSQPEVGTGLLYQDLSEIDVVCSFHESFGNTCRERRIHVEEVATCSSPTFSTAAIAPQAPILKTRIHTPMSIISERRFGPKRPFEAQT